ncbi:uncharacterized protein LOC127835389 isoform X2 [Dreissena polymorpha]|uniref:Uncharacterized protein n=1 Tax=Dreissena polymorpha TaxID=45954 RepID=A0A9D4MX86_DREPO|nr:uncharacterized protein LOC127835389 isoform X2 [Dreissena polymorpha]KAH3883870.1 hypothetical protein DPMN_007838 [Dreissena polymorpha]
MSDLIHGDVRENKETDVDAVMEIYSELSEIHEEDDHERSNNAAVGTMTMAEKHVELVQNSARISGKDPVAMNAADTAGSLRADEYCTTGLHGEVNLGFKVESDEDDDFHFTQLVRSRSDDLLEIQRLNMTREIVENLEDSPSAVSEVNARDFVGIQQPTSQEQFKLEGSSCTDSPGLASQEGGAYETGTEDDEDYYIETDGDVRIALIEEEYVDRMTLLESRNYDLEVVLHRLTTAIERLLSLQDADMPNGETDEVPGSEMRTEVEADEFNEESNPEMGDIDSRKAEIQEAANDSEKIESATGDTTDIGHNTAKDSDALTDCNDTTDAPENASNPHKDTAGPTEDTIDGEMTTVKTEALIDSTAHVVSRNICIDLFIEFQKRLAMFAGELKGVLTCSDVAIRHARIFHEWGKSKQLLSEQLQHERKKMMSYIEEREKTMTVVRDQFKKELEEQGTKLENLVEEMTKYQNLMDTSDNLLKDKVVEYSQRRAVAESLTEVLLKRRLDEERSIILDLTKQSEISMMKLFIMHQQNCIQDLQIQNREQRAIIEGLMGPDDTEDDEPTDTDPTSTPVSVRYPAEHRYPGKMPDSRCSEQR